MPGAKKKENQGVSRRGVLAGAGAVALGAGLRLKGPSSSKSLQWDDGDPAFEAPRRLRVGEEIPGPVRVRLEVETPAGPRTLGEQMVAPGDHAEWRLEYPFEELLAGRYVYRAEAEDSDGRILRSDPVEVLLREYRFGC